MSGLFNDFANLTPGEKEGWTIEAYTPDNAAHWFIGRVRELTESGLATPLEMAISRMLNRCIDWTADFEAGRLNSARRRDIEVAVTALCELLTLLPPELPKLTWRADGSTRIWNAFSLCQGLEFLAEHPRSRGSQRDRQNSSGQAEALPSPGKKGSVFSEN